MNRTTLIALGLLASIITPSIVESSTDSVPYYMFNAASTFKIDVALLYALCTKESRCNPKAINKDDATRSNKALGVIEHSHGLFQIKLATAKGLGFKGTKKELMKPEINTWYAAKLVRHLYNRYHNTTKVISAYNAGRAISGNKTYVDTVLRHYVHYKIDRGL